MTNEYAFSAFFQEKTIVIR